MTTCKIQWIDKRGEPTPDSNPAIGHVMLPSRVIQAATGGITLSASGWIPVCAEHAKQLREPGMEYWIFEPLEDLST